MPRYDYPDAAATPIEPMTEAQLAEQRVREGDVVRYAHGRYWREFRRGFFEAIHWLAAMRLEEARRPGLCWGYRTTLHQSVAASANASLPIHLIDDVANYERACLPNDAHRSLRRLDRRGVRIVRLTDMRLLEDQGYEIFLDWRARVRLAGPPPSREQYLQDIGRHLHDPGWLLSAAMDGDRMLGYQTAWAVDDAAYLQEIKVPTSELSRGITVALDHEAIRVFQQSGRITRITSGIHEPERPSLTLFKLRHCFVVVHVPARVWMLPPADLLLRSRRPLAYYRMTGRGAYPDAPAELMPASSDAAKSEA